MERETLRKITEKVIMNPKAGRKLMNHPAEMINRMVFVDEPVARQYPHLDLSALVKAKKIRNMLPTQRFKEFKRLHELEGCCMTDEEASEAMAAVSTKRNRD